MLNSLPNTPINLQELELGILTLPKLHSVIPEKMSLLSEYNGYIVQSGDSLYVFSLSAVFKMGWKDSGLPEVDHPAYLKYISLLNKEDLDK